MRLGLRTIINFLVSIEFGWPEFGRVSITAGTEIYKFDYILLLTKL
jgi:hypothetical protein